MERSTRCKSCFMILFVHFAAVVASTLSSPPPKVAHFTLARISQRQIVKRDNVIDVTLGNAYRYGVYYLNVSVGDPPQQLSLQIDTGSSDVWMFAPHSCDLKTSPCVGGAFDISESTSSHLLVKGGFEIEYETQGSAVSGDYISDSFTVGNTTIQNLTMGLAYQSENVATGIMGIGFDSGESITLKGGKPYNNIVDEMVSQGLISSRSYSLWLSDMNEQTGTILFGGYDTTKYLGDLVALNMQPDARTGRVTTMSVALTYLSISDPVNGIHALTANDFVVPAILDSGTTLTKLPTAIYDELAALVNAIPSENGQYDYVSCDALIDWDGAFLNFGFGGAGGPRISVAFEELAVPAYDNNGTQLRFEDGSRACYFGASRTGPDERVFLGDTFLRSAYVVYDLDQQTIAIAPTNFGGEAKEDVHEIAGGGNGILAAVSSVETAVTAEQTATGNGGAPAGFLNSATSSGLGISAPPTGVGVLSATASSTSLGASPTGVASKGNVVCAGQLRLLLVLALCSIMQVAYW